MSWSKAYSRKYRKPRKQLDAARYSADKAGMNARRYSQMKTQFESEPESKRRHQIRHRKARRKRMRDPRYRARINRENLRWRTKRLRENLGFRILHNARVRLYKAVKGALRNQRTVDLIGCSMDFLLRYIEAQWKPGMSWRNYGTKWEIDHRRPCASFDLTDPKQLRQCFHYTNLQPLWCRENKTKAARMEVVLSA